MAGMAKVGMLVHHSPTRYLEGFSAWRGSIGTSRENLFSTLRSVVPDSLLCKEGGGVRVLGIGSGSGEVDSVILKKILRNHDSVYTRVVEQAEEMIVQYKTLVRNDASLATVEFDWRQQKAEEYFQTAESTKFNLVHAVQVLYDVDDHNTTLRNMWEQLADGGYMLVVLKSDKGEWGKLWHKLWERFGDGDRLKTSLRTSSDVKQWLDTMGISYATAEHTVLTNVTECFNEESKTGMLILDFLTQTPYVSNVPEIKSMALEYIRRNSMVVNNELFFETVEETIVAFKKK